jgi:hypothetical protein
MDYLLSSKIIDNLVPACLMFYMVSRSEETALEVSLAFIEIESSWYLLIYSDTSFTPIYGVIKILFRSVMRCSRFSLSSKNLYTSLFSPLPLKYSLA